MAEYNTSAANAESALESSISTMVEEYQTPNGARVRRGRGVDQIAALARLEGLASRRSGGGCFKLAKHQEPTS